MTVTAIKDEAEFQDFLKRSEQNDTLLIVDFTATWCGPCKMIAPQFETLSEQYTAVVFVKVDVDALAGVARTYEIRAMPTFVLIKSGKKVGESVGASIDNVKKLIDSNA